MDDKILFSHDVGFRGKTVYSLRYIIKTRCFRYAWPFNNCLARCKDEAELLKTIFQQNVGVSRVYSYNDCSELKFILRQLFIKHKNTNYETVFKKLLKNTNFKIGRKNRDNLPVPRQLIKTYVRRIIYNIIPLKLFGNASERSTFEKNVKKILFLGKKQVFSLSMLMHHVQINNKKYLNSFTEHTDKTNLIAKLYVWLVKSFIFAAIKTVFYVTETNVDNKYVFYDKSTWQKIHQLGFDSIKKYVVSKYKTCIIQSKTSSPRCFILRITPKRRGSRPIYLKWKKDWIHTRTIGAPDSRKVTEVLKAISGSTFDVLINSSAQSIHSKWTVLYYNWLAMGKPTVYFIRCDFFDAFGSINTEKLMELIEQAAATYSGPKEINFQYNKGLQRVTISNAINLIKKYLNDFAFKHNKYIYKLASGIPQGGSMSSTLCNFYFGQIDASYLTKYSHDSGGFLLRICDDYLYVTVDLENAQNFLTLMTKGFVEYNLKLNTDKTKTNLIDEHLHHTTFNIYRFNFNNFQVCRNYDVYRTKSLFHCSAFVEINNPGKLILRRVVYLCKQGLEPIFHDDNYNSWDTVMCNLYQSAELSGARFCAFINFYFTHFNQKFLFRCILTLSWKIMDLELKRTQNSTSSNDRNNRLFHYIILEGFCIQLKKYPNRFCVVLKWIKDVQEKLHAKFSKKDNHNLNMFLGMKNEISIKFFK